MRVCLPRLGNPVKGNITLALALGTYLQKEVKFTGTRQIDSVANFLAKAPFSPTLPARIVFLSSLILESRVFPVVKLKRLKAFFDVGMNVICCDSEIEKPQRNFYLFIYLFTYFTFFYVCK